MNHASSLVGRKIKIFHHLQGKIILIIILVLNFFFLNYNLSKVIICTNLGNHRKNEEVTYVRKKKKIIKQQKFSSGL